MFALLALLFLFLDESKPTVPVLVKQLGADTRAERDAASSALEKLGATALKELRVATRSKDAEIRRRSRRIIEKIERTLFHEVRIFSDHSGSVNGVAFSPDGKLAASTDTRGVHLWDLATGKRVGTGSDHRDRVMVVCFSPDGKILATGSEDRTVRIWKTADLTCLHELRGHEGYVRGLQFSREGKTLISCGLGGQIREWDVAVGKELRSIKKADRRFFSLVVLPDMHHCLTAATQSDPLELWDLQKPTSIELLRGHTRQSLSLALTRNGKIAISGSKDTTVRVWDVITRKEIIALRAHTKEVTAVAIRADGSLGISGGCDHELHLWDIPEGRHIRILRGHTGNIWSVAISPDGKFALSGSEDGTMRLWSLGG